MKTATDATGDDASLPTTFPADDSTPPSTDESWVAHCQRQFSGSTRRLHNLVDDENHAIYDGV